MALGIWQEEMLRLAEDPIFVPELRSIILADDGAQLTHRAGDGMCAPHACGQIYMYGSTRACSCPGHHEPRRTRVLHRVRQREGRVLAARERRKSCVWGNASGIREVCERCQSGAQAPPIRARVTRAALAQHELEMERRPTS